MQDPCVCKVFSAPDTTGTCAAEPLVSALTSLSSSGDRAHLDADPHDLVHIRGAVAFRVSLSCKFLL